MSYSIERFKEALRVFFPLDEISGDGPWPVRPDDRFQEAKGIFSYTPSVISVMALPELGDINMLSELATSDDPFADILALIQDSTNRVERHVAIMRGTLGNA